MDENRDRRTEQRLRYYWPIWYAENVDYTLSQGQKVDLALIEIYLKQELEKYG